MTNGVSIMRRILFFSGILGAVALFAQGPGPGSDPGSSVDPPSRVARLNFIDGAVSFQPASLDTWTAASLNYPLTTGDHIYTDERSRAEMHIGANVIRLDSTTNFGFLNLDDTTVQMRFTEGAMEVRLRNIGDRELYEIDTPQGAVSLLQGGDYRIDTDPDRNATMVTVNAGEAEVTANGNSFPVHPRQTAYFGADGAPDVRDANPLDDFDRFNADRNSREERRPPPQHVPVSMIGSEDLDSYGAWREVPEYGWVWAPPVRAGWVPYHDGHWAWVEPWGWTWVDDAPWGFAPFHYGRWAVVGGGWVWIPGSVRARPVYAPALVAFVGGPHFSAGIGIGGGVGAVAWFPLGPQEVYRPVYRTSPTYVRNVNITNVTNVTNITNVNVTNVRYVNQNVQGAVTAVPQNAFVSSRPVASAATRLDAAQLAGAQVQAGAQVAPTRQSFSAVGAANVPRPRDAVMARQVVAKTTPPPPPIAFQAKQAALTQSQGRPLAAEQINQIRQQQPTAVANRPAVRMAPPTGAFAQPARQPAPVAPVQPGPANGGGVRLDSRPPNARPLQTQPVPAPVQTPRPEMPQPRQMPESRPVPQQVAPQVVPRPEVPQRQMPENRPVPQQIAPQVAPRPEMPQRQMPENRPVPQQVAPQPRPAQPERPKPAPQRKEEDKKP
jgi:hypothetical protein